MTTMAAGAGVRSLDGRSVELVYSATAKEITLRVAGGIDEVRLSIGDWSRLISRPAYETGERG